MFSKTQIMKSTNDYSHKIDSLRKAIDDTEAVLIGAGAGLSTASGLSYTGERFYRFFSKFIDRYQFTDMYSATFYPYETPEEYWGYMSMHIYVNRYLATVGKPILNLLKLVKDKDYFVLTTNVDHQFQKAGIDKHKLFYTQGDYGLWQCSKPCHNKTYDNERAVREMLREEKDLCIPAGLIPHCPKCGEPMTMNLRCDNTFVQDDGWHSAFNRYNNFVRRHQNNKILYLELGVGNNTPGIIKYPFWEMTAKNPNATYACINLDKAVSPREIEKQSICISGDIRKVVEELK